MAENKKSFILYSDLLSIVEKLPDEIAGKLFKIILNYVNDKNPVVEDLLLQVAFEPIKLQLKRDLKKFESKKERLSDSGKLGGVKSGETRRKLKEIEANEANASNLKPSEANEAVNDNVTVNDTVSNIINNNSGKNIFPSMPNVEDVGPAPKTKINSAIEMLKITNNVDVGEKQVITMWDIFKDQNLTGKRYYPDKDAVYSHFLNWIIKKDFKNQKNGTDSKKTGTKYFTKATNNVGETIEFDKA